MELTTYECENCYGIFAVQMYQLDSEVGHDDIKVRPKCPYGCGGLGKPYDYEVILMHESGKSLGFGNCTLRCCNDRPRHRLTEPISDGGRR